MDLHIGFVSDPDNWIIELGWIRLASCVLPCMLSLGVPLWVLTFYHNSWHVSFVSLSETLTRPPRYKFWWVRLISMQLDATWTIQISLNVFFSVPKIKSYGALIATMNDTHSTYFSCVVTCCPSGIQKDFAFEIKE